LLVDLNRSRGSRTLFSEITRPLSKAEKNSILARYHAPYWRAVEDIAVGIIASGKIALHLSVHSFTPFLYGHARTADIGLLYDPRHPAEKSFCLAWQKELNRIAPTLRIRRNYPYRGTADALVTALRKRFPEGDFLGIELEINQKHPLENGESWHLVQESVKKSLWKLLDPCRPAN
jgi:predicted N-formylglutamate amidohydrolase